MLLKQILVVGTALSLATAPVWATMVTPKELAQAREWSAARFGEKPSAEPPFSFIYGGQPSSELLKTWKVERQSRKIDEAKTERTVIYTDPATGLTATCRAIEYSDFPTLEWVVCFKNTGQKDTAILENIQAMDLRLQRSKDEAEFVLHHNRGTPNTPQDYEPFATTLEPGKDVRFGAIGGRPMNTDMPYFNVAWGSKGMIVVLSWVGQWSSAFVRDAEGGLRITGGQDSTHFKLLPGEEVRTPLIAVQLWEGGDVVRAQNIWRRWMIAHNLPRPGGKPFPPVISAGAPGELFPNLVYSAKDDLSAMKISAEKGLKFDYWWLDAGWYPCGDAWWRTIGTWQPDPVRYPKGLREVADEAHAQGMKFTVWFEPERVTPGSWLDQNHPEWLLGPKGESNRFLDLGNPDARAWITDYIANFITEQHIDMYRQDYNADPLGCWRYNEPADRQGITEIKNVTGLLAFWDGLQKRHPNMPFDNCAGGGRRNVLEMMRRGVPLSKSDTAGGTTSTQCQTYGIAAWLPYFGAGCPLSKGRYFQRSNMAPWVGTAENVHREELDYADMRRFIAEWRRVIPHYWGDFYPLTPYSLEETVWMAWQFDGPEPGTGIVQAFRREQSTQDTQVYKLRGLDPDLDYVVEDLDTARQEKVSGARLMNEGLPISMAERPGAKVLVYGKAGRS